MQHTKLISALAAAALGASGGAFAAGQGDFLVRGGFAVVDPSSDSDTLPGTQVGVSVKSGIALGLTGAYFITDNIAVELLASTPFQHDIKATGSLGGNSVDGLDVADVRHLPPTLSIQYHIQSGGPIRPYVGVGVNFTRFFDDDLEQETRALGFNDIDLENSWGVAAQLGADYELANGFLFNTAVRFIDIDTDARLNNPNGEDPELDVEVDPLVFEVGIGYVF